MSYLTEIDTIENEIDNLYFMHTLDRPTTETLHKKVKSISKLATKLTAQSRPDTEYATLVTIRALLVEIETLLNII